MDNHKDKLKIVNNREPDFDLLHFRNSHNYIFISKYSHDYNDDSKNFIKIGMGYMMRSNVIIEIVAIQLGPKEVKCIVVHTHIGLVECAVLEHSAVSQHIEMCFRIVADVFGIPHGHFRVEVEIAGITLVAEIRQTTPKRIHSLIEVEAIE